MKCPKCKGPMVGFSFAYYCRWCENIEVNNMKCLCKNCPNDAVEDDQKFTANQRAMQGFFCSKCIGTECANTCKNYRIPMQSRRTA